MYLPAVADIAAAAGLAKGTVHLYFATREAIFAELLLDGWGALLRELDEAFGKGTAPGREKVSRFLSRLVAYMHRYPELLRLDALGHGVVERNLEPKTLCDFKHTLNERLMGGGVVVEAALVSGGACRILARGSCRPRRLPAVMFFRSRRNKLPRS